MTRLIDELTSPYLSKPCRAELEIARERRDRAHDKLVNVDNCDNTAGCTGLYGQVWREYHAACERVRELEYEIDG